jgi:hypothetical protein
VPCGDILRKDNQADRDATGCAKRGNFGPRSRLIAVGSSLVVPCDTAAEVIKAVQTRPWIHGLQKLPDGSQREMWMSPAREVYGMRFGDGSAIFDDATTKTRSQYLLEQGDKKEFTLYRVPLLPAIAATAKQYEMLFQALMRGDMSPDLSWPMLSCEYRTVTEADEAWVEFEFLLRHCRDETSRCVIRIDSKTKLPASMRILSKSDQPLLPEIVFDYPDENAGPRDVYDLGVPRTAKVVDRMPSAKLAEIFAAVREGQRRFGPYFAVVAHTHGRKAKPWQAVQLDLVWRKGVKFRIETASLSPERWPPEEPPADANMIAWWVERLKTALIIPQRVCDGKVVWIGETAHAPIDGKQQQVPVTWRRFRGVSGDDDFNSWVGCVSTATMPDVMAYGHTPDSSPWHEVVLLENPAEGPASCLLAETRLTREEDNAYHLTRNWFDPRHAYVMRRIEVSDLRSKEDNVGKWDAYDVEKIEQAPSGVWYPTCVRRSYGPKPVGEQYFWFFVDFRAQLPDSLFMPDARTDG